MPEGGWDYLKKLQAEDRAAKRTESGYKPRPVSEVEASEMFAALLKLTDGLSEWEVDFIESLSKWKGPFTDRQRGMIDKIHYEKLRSATR